MKRRPLKLWRWKQRAGVWEVARAIENEQDAPRWVKIFTSSEPGAIFELSRRRPSKSPSIPRQLEAKDRWKAQGDWVPASGGTEQPFWTRTGRRLQYVYQPRTGRHAYLDLGTDVILTDEEALLALGNR